MDQMNILHTVKQYGMTGNPVIDGLIIANIIPLVIGYIQFVLNFVKDLLAKFAEMVHQKFSTRIKNKIMGKELCKIQIFSENKILYDAFRQTIFNTSVKSDVDTTKIKLIINATCSKENILKSYLDNDMEYSLNYELKGYSLDDAFTFEYSNVTPDSIKTEIKMFNFETRHLKCELSEKMIVISLISFNPNDKATDDVIPKIEKYLKARFMINQKLNFTYKIRLVDPQLSQIIYNYVSTQRMRCGKLLLSGGDKSSHWIANGINAKLDEFYAHTNEYELRMTPTNYNDPDTDYKNNMELADEQCTVTTQSYNVLDLVKYYLGRDAGVNINYCYYVALNNLILVEYTANYATFYIISKSSKSKENITSIVGDFVQKSVSNKINVPQSVNGSQQLHVRKNGGWYPTAIEKRDFSTIYLPKKLLREIRQEFIDFVALKGLYKSFQIPHRKGIMFHGPPGTDKTSLVKVLASEYQLNVYSINVNDDDINDETIGQILNSLGGCPKILLFEDIDSAFKDPERMANEHKITSEVFSIGGEPNVSTTKHKYLTYSGLLNALDGVASSQDGVITIMTTNYLEKLGKALIRPGRIDKIFCLKECDQDQIIDMSTTFINKRKTIKLTKDIILRDYTVDIAEFAKKLVNDELYPFQSDLPKI